MEAQLLSQVIIITTGVIAMCRTSTITVPEYHKIDTVFKRDERGRIILGAYSTPAFEYLKDCIWEWTEKVDGTNIRVIWKDCTISFAGRHENSVIPAHLANRLHELFDDKYEMFQRQFGVSTAVLFGEGCGQKIQKVGHLYNPSGVDFVLFDVWVNGWWLMRSDVKTIGETFGIQVVPVVGSGTIAHMIRFVEQGLTSYWGDFTAEGIVARPKVELKSRSGNRIITKLKVEDFRNIQNDIQLQFWK